MPNPPSSIDPLCNSLIYNSAASANSTCHLLDDKAVDVSDVVLELRVRNHPGTMSHITGLFARRAFNLDAILCVPARDASTSRVLLLVRRDSRLPQLARQLERLHDVLELRERADLSRTWFEALDPS